MLKSTLCFTVPVSLSLKLGQIVIKFLDDDRPDTSRPIEDVGVVILENQHSVITTALLSALADGNVAVVTCNKSHMPSGLLMPLNHSAMPGDKIAAQVGASRPLVKQLWQQTVIAKITNQAAVLSHACSGETSCMSVWAKSVRSGDPDNLEARAAIFYWHNLFDPAIDFKRSDDSLEINSLLNYGYAILRAVIARSLVATGLLPSIGIFHNNKYNAYCLADDVMEPYRPVVDRLVLEVIKKHGVHAQLTKPVKSMLLTIPTLDVKMGSVTRPLMVAATMTTASLAKCFTGEARKILYPSLAL